jgi:hypothetical protein
MQISSFLPSFGTSPTKAASNSNAASAADSTGATTGTTPTPTSETGGLTSKGDDVVQQFMDYAKMNPLERLRANILKSMGLTEDDLKKMTPEQQKAVEQKIDQLIKQELQKNAGKTGQVVDLSA